MIYVGAFLYTPTVQAKSFYSFDADLKNLNLQGKSIFWGFAYQSRVNHEVVFEEAVITSGWNSGHISVTIYNGHSTPFEIPVMCIAFAT